jgi:hypothetical protein
MLILSLLMSGWALVVTSKPWHVVFHCWEFEPFCEHCTGEAAHG